MTRRTTSLNGDWRFALDADIPAEARIHGNVQIIANETSLWQKAGNHGLSRTGNPALEEWREVRVPHDYALDGEFTVEVDAKVGGLRREPAVYARVFELDPVGEHERVHIEFDGVFRDSRVFVNGHFVGRHLSGYTSFAYDITELCETGANTVVVHVDPTDNELWSYEGAGVYREVRLVRTADVYIDARTLHVRAKVDGSVAVDLPVANMSFDPVDAVVRCTVSDGSGALVAESAATAVRVDDVATSSRTVSMTVADPRLWRPEDPALYVVRSEILVDDEVVDSVTTVTGFRDIRFDPSGGFFLNGVGMKLKGVCIHQDHAGVGIAVPPALQEWRMRQLKEMGCNAIRVSHNPPDPALLDACDRVGIMVMDEVRIPGIGDELLGQAEDLVRRDRNHPSVIMWSIGNEEMQLHGRRVGKAILKRMRHAVSRLDDRPTTYAMNQTWAELVDFHAEDGHFVDVFGSNYRSGQRSENYDDVHAKYPDWPKVATETFGGAATRGLYNPDRGSSLPMTIGDRWDDHNNFPDERFPETASAYGTTHTPWGYTIEETWRDCVARPFLSGTFIWTGFDYRGETFPYDWPSVISRFGILDYCGFPKEIAHYLRAWWRPEDAYTFVMPHWTWYGREGQQIDVQCYSNAARVQIQVNGEVVADEAMPVNGRVDASVTYAPGELVTIGFDADGVEVSRDTRSTVSAPARIQLAVDRDRLRAGGDDLAVVVARVVDAEGRLHPLSDETLFFEVSGPGAVLGTGNGDPNSHESDRAPQRRAFHGLAEVLVRTTDEEGEITVSASGWNLGTTTLTLQSVADPGVPAFGGVAWKATMERM
ncbi:glycoside hydrolase family 2 TIM barrel-domain containing protein [Microbacterium sp. AK031]|uniref:glycoside hydrolase family 2 TIM barrel-domain containing protein n=1 Tax=Microbacterium sp. AK031 TaxID=2723076 RepID=UPI00216A2649|nr:glycoside hydrolase family 2 TIM barrel-domain containing protein [Microbacterium sp. AK031]MCS3844090.1 beta-galactosidase [Microbacterium sp. AK031]